MWFENQLMQLVLRHLAEMPVTNPTHRYLLVEVADECRLSTTFGEHIAGPAPRRGALPKRRPADGGGRCSSPTRVRAGSDGEGQGREVAPTGAIVPSVTASACALARARCAGVWRGCRRGRSRVALAGLGRSR
ncbi:MAG: diiron oxygenase [Ilumatobacteraceae bacterium]